MKIKYLPRAKYYIFWGIAFFLFLSALITLAFFAKKEGKERLLLVSPSQFSSPGINTGKIEEFTENNFPLTYELYSSEKISLAYAEFSVIVISTNSYYPQLTGNQIIEGSFFSKQGWKNALRHAVLNETAAFTIFGSSRITGNRFRIKEDTWLVTGVIKDGKNESIIYIPSSLNNVNNSNVSDILALMSPSLGFDETYIKNSLKALGIHENFFNFYNLGSQVNLLFERPQVILCLFFVIILLFLFVFLTGESKKSIAELKNELDKKYARELLRQKRKILFKPALISLLLVCCPLLALLLLIRAVSIILPWQDIPSLFECRELFYPHIQKLYNFEFASILIFFVMLILLAVFIIMRINKKFHFSGRYFQ